MTRNYLQRGSEWRKWDLHVHTPETLKEDFFEGSTTEEKWGNFCDTINNHSEDISVIGITDYLLIDNYHKFKSLVDDGKITKQFDFIIPNIELRLVPVTGDGNALNLHLLINPDFVSQIDERIYSKLIMRDGTNTYNASKDGLTRLGKSINNRLTNEEAYKKGARKFVIDSDALKTIFDNDPSLSKDCIVVVSNSSNDGASGITNHSSFFTDNSSDLDIKRQSIYKFSNMIFSANPKDIDYFLGNSMDTKKQVVKKCDSLKPCIHGSDAHTNLKVFNPDKERFCWIKSDTTFEGLKQVVHEPEDRVKIQESKPEEKKIYQIIDKVNFIDDNFIPEEILLNKNLTVIIGGKSTGKSILLRNIAQTIDSTEVENRLKEVGLLEYENKVLDFGVSWLDGQENKKNINTEVNKKIIYIPQSYLNRLVDKKEDKTAIDEIIKNVLGQDANIKNSFEKLKKQQRENEQSISVGIDNLFFVKKDMASLLEGIKVIGDKKGIESEIEKLKIEIVDLKKKSGMSEKELQDYDNLIMQSVNLKNKEEVYLKDKDILESIKADKNFIDPVLENLSKEIQGVLLREHFEIKEKYQKEWGSKVSGKIAEIHDKFIENAKQLEQNNIKIMPLIRKVVESESLDKKIKKLDDENCKLKIILDEEALLEKKKIEYKEFIEKILSDFDKFYKNIFSVKSEILKQTIISGEIAFDISINFRNRHFQTSFVDDVCNLKNINQFEEGVLNEYVFSDNTKLHADLKKIIQGVLQGSLVLKGSYSKREAIRKLLQNWYIFDYKITQNGDALSAMSPGKKSFVLLKLLVELDDSRCPILLDQPEDDLDNRSIYYDLVQFIKNKKKDRQIIIATHNPNLVVGADAECVIVANQKGEKSKNKTYQFEYISGALEDTFKLKSESCVLYKQGVQEHVCGVLEGGEEAFKQRKNKYNL